MLGKRITNFILQHLGRYLDIPEDSISVSLWSGDVSLRDIPLRSSAFLEWDLPIFVERGIVGQLSMKIPWTSLSSSAVVISVSDLFLLVKPNKCAEWDAVQEAKKAKLIKRRRIRQLMTTRQNSTSNTLRNDNGDNDDDDTETNKGFFDRLKEVILNNIQIEIRNVHIRYEDTSSREKLITFGLNIGELRIASCNEEWEKDFLKTSTSMILKRTELKNFAFYGNEKSLPAKGVRSHESFLTTMRSFSLDREDVILGPINGFVNTTIQRETNLDYSVPKYHWQFTFDDVSFNLDGVQYYNFLSALDYFAKSKSLERFRSMRPLMRPSSPDGRKMWFKYLLGALRINARQHRFAWDDVLQRKQDREQYIKLYKRKRGVSWLDPLEPEELKIFHSLETKLDFEDIVLYVLCRVWDEVFPFRIFVEWLISSITRFRDFADAEIEREQGTFVPVEQKQEENNGVGWMQWIMGRPQAEDVATPSQRINELTDEEKRELYKTIGYEAQQDTSNNASLPSDFVLTEFNFHLKKGPIGLKDPGTRKTFIQVCYNDIKISFKRAVKSTNFELELGGCDIFDRYSAHALFEKIAYRRQTNSDMPLLRLSIHSGNATNPFSRTHSPASPTPHVSPSLETDSSTFGLTPSAKVEATLQGIDFVVNASLLQKLFAFITIPGDIDFSTIKQIVKSRLSNLKTTAQQSIRKALSHKKLVELNVRAKAPKFIIPENCSETTKQNTLMVIADLGRFKICSNLEVKSKDDEHLAKFATAKRTYDNITHIMTIKEMMVNTTRYEKWSQDPTRHENRVQNQLLHKTDFHITLSHLVSPSVHRDMPKSTLLVNVKSFNLNLSLKKANCLVRVLNRMASIMYDPTGMARSESIFESTLSIHVPDLSDAFHDYWVEWKRTGLLLLFESSTSPRPLATLNINDASCTLEKGALLDEPDVCTAVIEFSPQQNQHQQQRIVIFFPDKATEDRWSRFLNELKLQSMRNDALGQDVSRRNEDTSIEDFHLHHRSFKIKQKSSTQINLLSRFHLEAFSIVLRHEKNDFSKIVVRNIRAEHRTRQYDQSSQLNVKSVVIHSTSSINKNGTDDNEGTPRKLQKKTLVCDGGDENFADINLLTTNHGSPAYQRDTVTCGELKLHTIKVFFDREELVTYAEFLLGLETAFKKVSHRTRYYTGMQVEERMGDDRPSLLMVNAEIASIQILIGPYGQHFMTIAMDQSEGRCAVYHTGKTVSEGQVSNFTFLDHSAGAHYRNILGPNENGCRSISKFSFTTLPTPPLETREITPFYSKIFRATVSSAKFVFLQRVFRKLNHYIFKGPLTATFNKSRQQKQQQQQDESKEQATSDPLHKAQHRITDNARSKFMVDIQLTDPVVVFPAGYDSDDYIIARMDYLKVETAIKAVQFTHRNWLETTSIKLHQCCFLTFSSSESSDIQQPEVMIPSANMDICITKSVNSYDEEVPKYQFEWYISEIDLNLSHDQYQILHRVTQRNFRDPVGKETEDSTSDSTSTQFVTPFDYETIKKQRKEEKNHTINHSSSLYTIRIPHICLTISREDIRIAKLEFSNTIIQNETYWDKSKKLMFSIGTINGTDLRKETINQFRKFLQSGVNDNDKFMSVEAETLPNGNAIKHITMGGPRIMIEPGIFYRITTYFRDIEATQQENGNAEPKQFDNENEILTRESAKGDIMLVEINDTTTTTESIDIVSIVDSDNIYDVDDDDDDDNIYIDGDATSDLLSEYGDDESEAFYDAFDNADDGLHAEKDEKEDAILFEGFPKFILAANLADPSSLFLAVECRLALNFQQTHMVSERGTLHIVDTRVFIEDTTGQPLQGTPILKPTNLFVDVTSTFQDAKILIRTVNLHMENEVNLRVAYKDLVVLFKILRGFSQYFPQGDDALPHKPSGFPPPSTNVSNKWNSQTVDSNDDVEYLQQQEEDLNDAEANGDEELDAEGNNVGFKPSLQTVSIASLQSKEDLYGMDFDQMEARLPSRQSLNRRSKAPPPIPEHLLSHGVDESYSHQRKLQSPPPQQRQQKEEDEVIFDVESERGTETENRKETEVVKDDSSNEDNDDDNNSSNSNSNLNDDNNDDYDDDMFSTLMEESQGDDKLHIQYNLQFETASPISIIFVDDSRNFDVPLFNANFTEMKVNPAIVMSNGLIDVQISMFVDLFVFNLKNFRFEPCLEPWGMVVHYARKLAGESLPLDDQPKPHQLFVSEFVIKNYENVVADVLGTEHLPAKEIGLNVNISKGLIDAVTTAFKLWFRSKHKVPSRERIGEEDAKYNPYTIRNFTGLHISWWENESGAQEMKLQPGKEDSFSLIENTKRTDIHTWNSDVTICVCVPEFEIIRLSMRKEAHLKYVNKSARKIIMIDVKHLDVQTTITVRSGIGVQNCTDHSLEFGLVTDDSEMDTIQSFGTVEPNDSLYLPVGITNNGSVVLCMRPHSINDDNPHQVTAGWYRFEGNHALSEIVTTRTKNRIIRYNSMEGYGESEPIPLSDCHYLMRVSTLNPEFVKQDAEKSETSAMHCVEQLDIRLHICAPFALENLLPFAVDVDLFAKVKTENEKLWSGRMAKGARRMIYKWNVESPILMRASPAGSQWRPSEQLSILHEGYSPNSLHAVIKHDRHKVVHNELTRTIKGRPRSTSGKSTPAPPHTLPRSTSFLVHNDEFDYSLAISIDHVIESHSSFHEARIFCRYWILNHTGQTLLTKRVRSGISTHQQILTSPCDTQSHVAFDTGQVEDLSTPLLLSFADVEDREKSRMDASCISIGINDSTFSDPFPLESIGPIGDFELVDEQHMYSIVYSMQAAPGRFHRTNVITFGARHVIVNKDRALTIHCKQHGVPISQDMNQVETLSLPCGTMQNMTWNNRKKDRLMIRITTDTEHMKWSPAFRLSAVGEMYLKILPKPTAPQGTESLILCATIVQDNGVVYVAVEEAEKPPYIIENRLDVPVEFAQICVANKWTLNPRCRVPFAWDDLMQPQILSIRVGNTSVPKRFHINNVTSTEEKIKIGITGMEREIYVSVDASGPTRIFRISNSPIAKKSSLEETVSMQLTVEIPSVGVSIVNSHPIEVAYLYLESLNLRARTTDKSTYGEVTVGRMQVDNQLRATQFPVAFTGSHRAHSKQFIHLSMVKSATDDGTHRSTFTFFHYFGIQMQEANLALDYDFIKSMGEFVGSVILTPDISDEDAVNQILQKHNTQGVASKLLHAQQRKLYFEKLEIHPIQINTTLRLDRSENVDSTTKNKTLDLLGRFSFIVNANNAPIRFNALILEHPFLSRAQLVDSIKEHYKSSVIKELYKVVGSSDLIGNPIGLFNDVSMGLRDLWYEPHHAWVNSPEDFGWSLARGASSFVSHSTHGVLNTTAKLTGQVAQGMGYLSFDSNYIRQRRMLANKRAHGIKEGLIHGGTAMARGFIHGAVDVIYQPVIGAHKEGVFGFVRGVGRGLAGQMFKPMIGVMEFNSKLAEGISNSLMKEQRGRVRLPRLFFDDSTLYIYDETKAYAQHLLAEISNGQFASETLLLCCPNDKYSVIVLTRQSVMCIKHVRKTLAWRVEVGNILKMSQEENGAIILRFQEVQEKGIFSTKKTNVIVDRPIVANNDSTMLQTIRQLLNEQISTHNNHIDSYFLDEDIL